MYKNNSPPKIKSMCGIDSLHIMVRCSIPELKAFVYDECEKGISIEKRTKWTTELKIILAGEKIRVVATKRRTCRFEFGGLYCSDNSLGKLQFIRRLTRKFPDHWKVQRLDFACDLKVDYRDVRISPSMQDSVSDKYRDTYSINRKTKARTFSWCVYDKSKRLEIFSFPLTRIELRLYKQTINNRALGDCFNEADSFRKCIKTIHRLFERLDICIKGQSIEGLVVDAENVLENFVEFLHSDCQVPKARDHFHIGEALVARDKIKQWMETETVSWKDLPVHCKKVQKKVCTKVGISEPTLRKAIRYAKNY